MARMYAVLIVTACYALLRKKQRTSYIITATILAIFAISTFLWTSNLAVFIKRFNIALVRTDGTLLSRLDVADFSTEKLRYFSDIFFVISYLLGDALIAWRLVILGGRSIWIGLSMFILWIGSLATGFGLIGCLSHAHFPAPEFLPPLCSTLENASWVFSLALNALSTAILSRIAWLHRRNVSRHISSNGRTLADYALSTLAISGVVYFLLGVPRLTAFANQTVNPFPSSFTYATEIIESMLYQIVGLYPTTVIVVLLYRSDGLGERGHSTLTVVTSAEDSKLGTVPRKTRTATGLIVMDSAEDDLSTSSVHFHVV
ncbi:hypothetical protein EXIGLDRAFT_768249 [Exidia glandulosa HHB12029]|uniref:Family A G protein-coupled receptor-like protein n=1 Tax=Exidia glandulosa HHB12029 TaxID=1314781 RepID=A0A165ID22_EXIGL|nr:hypothetical protein EXIGLDRAFT_768249 [Exidia glandulosa HHB12029]